MVMNNDTSFGKVVAHDQLYHLVMNKINHVAMVTTFQKSKMAAIGPSFGFKIFFFKKTF